MLNEFQRVDFFGGKAHKISEKIYHLIRGEIYNIDGRKIFAFGGASSHDKIYRKENSVWVEKATISDGVNGKDGATIENVEFDDQGRLVITLTDGTVLDPVELPKKEEHIHSFGEWVETTEATTYCEDKRFYAQCSDCGEVKYRYGLEKDHTIEESGYCALY